MIRGPVGQPSIMAMLPGRKLQIAIKSGGNMWQPNFNRTRRSPLRKSGCSITIHRPDSHKVTWACFSLFLIIYSDVVVILL